MDKTLEMAMKMQRWHYGVARLLETEQQLLLKRIRIQVRTVPVTFLNPCRV